MVKECGWLDQEFYQHNPLLAGRGFPVYAGRSQSLEHAVTLLNSVNATKEDVRWRLPILALQGAPGTGKTDFLDQLAIKCIDKNNGTIVCGISFNGRTEQRTAFSRETELCLLVFYYFFCRDKLDWSRFRVAIEGLCDVRQLSLSNVFRACLKAAEAKRVFFFIDEISKSRNSAETLSAATAAMRALEVDRKTPLMRLLVTSLDAILPMDGAPDKHASASGTLIEWIALPLLPDPVVFGELVTVKWAENPILYQLYRRAGGHPRTLVSVHEAAKHSDSENQNYSEMLKSVFQQLRSRRLSLSGMKYEQLLPALLHQICQLDSKNGDTTYRNLIARGCFINASLKDDTKEFVPVLSTVQFALWLSEQQVRKSRPDLLVLNKLFEESSDFLRGNDDTFSHKGDRVPSYTTKDLYGEGMEKWHGYYEAFYRLAFRRIKMPRLNLAELYGVADQEILVTVPKSVFILKPNQKPNGTSMISNFPSLYRNLDTTGTWISLLYQFPTDLSTPEQLWNAGYSCILLLGGNFPGYDIMVVDRDLKKRPVYTLVQCKWSNPFGSGTISAKALLNALTKARQHLTPFLDPGDSSSSLLPAIATLEHCLSSSPPLATHSSGASDLSANLTVEKAKEAELSVEGGFGVDGLHTSLDSMNEKKKDGEDEILSSSADSSASSTKYQMLNKIPAENVRYVLVTQLGCPKQSRSIGSVQELKQMLVNYGVPTKQSRDWKKDQCVKELNSRMRETEAVGDNSEESASPLPLPVPLGRGTDSVEGEGHLLQQYKREFTDGLLIRDRDTLGKLYGETLLQLLPTQEQQEPLGTQRYLHTNQFWLEKSG